MPTLPPTQATAHPVHTGQAFAIISGEEPRHVPEVRGGHKALEQLLAQNGVKYEATDANFGNGVAHSPVIIAYGLGRNQAMDIGRKMGQESIIFSNGGQHEFIYTNGPNAGRFHPSMAQPMEIFPSLPDEGLTTRIPGVGHVRFNFDHGKLLDVPRKGSAMSEDTKKSEVSVTEFKQRLADVLRGKIEQLSKSMEGYASREVAGNDEALVGDFRRSQATLSLQEWDIELGIFRKNEACLLCGQPGACACLLQDLSKAEKLSKSHTLAIASAMKRVYDSYLKNVGQVQFPNDPNKAHEVAMSAAKDWASRAKDPRAVYQMALGHSGEGLEQAAAVAHAPSSNTPPDSMSPAPVPGAKAGGPIVKNANIPGKQDTHNLEEKFFAGKAPAYAPQTPAPSPTHSKPPVQPARLPGYGTPYRKEEMAGTCKNCKNELCKGCDGTAKAELPPGFRPTHGSQTQRKKQNLQDRKTLERLGTPKDVERFDASNRELAMRRKGLTVKSDASLWRDELEKEELLQKPPTTEAQRRYVHWKAGKGVKWAKEWAAKDPGGKLPERAEKSEDFIDNKNANSPPTSTDEAKKGGKRTKNVGAETPDVAPPTKEVKGNLDEGSGGDVTKGKGLKKGDMPGTPGPMAGGPDAPPIAPLASAEMEKNVAPPTAKPPTANPTPGKPPMSKPKLPKKIGGLGKAALPMGTRSSAGAADAAAFAARQGQVGAKQGGTAAPPTPKAVPKPPSAFDAAAFQPSGPISSGLELDTGPKPGGFGVGPKLPTPGKVPGKP